MQENEVLENLIVVKRSGQRVNFNGVKIAIAIKQAFDSYDEDSNNEKKANRVYNLVLDYIVSVYQNRKTINVEDIQDAIENNLKKCGYYEVYQRFNEYRLQRAASREVFSVKEQHKFVKAVEKIGLNAKNYQGDKPIDLMLNFGKTISQEFARAYLIESKYNRAHEEGRIYIEDIKSYALKTTASSIIDLSFIEAQDITDFTLEIINIIEHFKEEQYMEQTIMDLDVLYKNMIIKEFKNKLADNIKMFFKVVGLLEFADFSALDEIIRKEKTTEVSLDSYEHLLLNDYSKSIFMKALDFTNNFIKIQLEKNIKKLLEHINNKVYKIASSKVNISFSSDYSNEAVLFKNIYFQVLNAIDNKNITTICKVNREFNYLVNEIYNRNDIIIIFLNNNSFDDTIDTFSDELMIYKNVNGELQTSRGKIKLSSVTINLARLGLKYNLENISDFYNELEDVLELSKNALIQRYELQASLYKENYRYILDNNMLYDAKKLEDNKRVRKVFRNGILNIKFSGLLEACEAMLKGSNNIIKVLDLGLEIVEFMQEHVQKFTNDLKLNFLLSEESSNLVNRKLLALDKTMYGNLDILKKECYSGISDFINKLDDNLKYKYAVKYQNICQFNLVIITSRNKSKILETLEKANKKEIKIVRLGVK